MRGLKQGAQGPKGDKGESHLLQMRGLKLTGEGDMLNPAYGRIFYRCVD